MVEPGLLDPECSMLTTLCLPQFYNNDLTKESSFEWQLSPILYSGWILWLDLWKSWLYSMQLWPGWLVQYILFLIWPMLLPTKILWWQMRCDWFRILCAKCRFHDIPSWGCHACDCKYFYFFLHASKISTPAFDIRYCWFNKHLLVIIKHYQNYTSFIIWALFHNTGGMEGRTYSRGGTFLNFDW